MGGAWIEADYIYPCLSCRCLICLRASFVSRQVAIRWRRSGNRRSMYELDRQHPHLPRRTREAPRYLQERGGQVAIKQRTCGRKQTAQIATNDQRMTPDWTLHSGPCPLGLGLNRRRHHSSDKAALERSCGGSQRYRWCPGHCSWLLDPWTLRAYRPRAPTRAKIAYLRRAAAQFRFSAQRMVQSIIRVTVCGGGV